MSADEIATEHDLSLSDVYAALAYYYDHREAIDPSGTTTSLSPSSASASPPGSRRTLVAERAGFYLDEHVPRAVLTCASIATPLDFNSELLLIGLVGMSR